MILYGVGWPGWVLPDVAILDGRGLNDRVVARTAPPPGKRRHMAHDRKPPPGYVQCFRPNATARDGVLTVDYTDGKGWSEYGWSEDELAEDRRPLRDDLDAAAPNNPVLLTRAGGHSGVANSLALELAGIDESTPQPEGGVIETDAAGRLTAENKRVVVNGLTSSLAVLKQLGDHLLSIQSQDQQRELATTGYARDLLDVLQLLFFVADA